MTNGSRPPVGAWRFEFGVKGLEVRARCLEFSSAAELQRASFHTANLGIKTSSQHLGARGNDNILWGFGFRVSGFGCPHQRGRHLRSSNTRLAQPTPCAAASSPGHEGGTR